MLVFCHLYENIDG